MSEQDTQENLEARKFELVKERARGFLLDQEFWRQHDFRDEAFNWITNPEGFQRLIWILGEVGEIVITDAMQSETLGKLYGSASNPRFVLERLNERFKWIRYGTKIATSFREQAYGLDRRGRHVPLRHYPQHPNSAMIDEKTDPEEFREIKQEQERAKKPESFRDLLEALFVREIITIQNRADLLLGAFVYCTARGWVKDLPRILSEIAWTLDQPSSVTIEKYVPLISQVRTQIENTTYTDTGKKSDVFNETFFSKNNIRTLDEVMEGEGFLWDKDQGAYLNLGIQH